MPSATFVPFNHAVGNVGAGIIRLGTDTVKAYLTDATPDLDNDAYKSDLAEIAAGNGYTAGGVTLTGVTFSEEAGSPQGVWVLSCDSFSWTATGGDIAQARYVALYVLGTGSPNEYLLGYADYGSEFNITSGNTLTVSNSNGVMEMKRGT
jgi:hypothetical protein